MQNTSHRDMDIRKFFWRPQKSNAAEDKESIKTNSLQSHPSSFSIPKKFEFKPSLNQINLNDLVPFQSTEMSQKQKIINEKFSQIQQKPNFQFKEEKKKEKQAKKKLRQMQQQLDKLLRLKKKLEKKQLKQQQKMKQIEAMLKEEEFPDVYHIVYDEELNKGKVNKKPIKYVRFLKNEQPIPKMSKEEFIRFGKKRIIAKVMSDKGYSMKDIAEAVSQLNSPTIKEITRTEMKNQSFNIIAATIRKLEYFLRVFAKKLPQGSNPQSFPLKKFVRKQNVKNKSHFIMNFVHRFEIAHKMTFMKFLFLEFRLKDVEISPQEAVDLIVYLGRNIEDPNYGYDRLVDVEDKREIGKDREEEFSAEQGDEHGLDESIKALEEKIRRQGEKNSNWNQPDVRIDRFDESKKNWQTDLQECSYPEISKPSQSKDLNKEKPQKSDFDYMKFYKNLTQGKKNQTSQQPVQNEAQYIETELQSFNQEDRYQNQSCKANYYPEMDENERSFIDELKYFDDQDAEDHQKNAEKQIDYQEYEDEDKNYDNKWQTQNRSRQYEKYYVQNRYQQPQNIQKNYHQPYQYEPKSSSKYFDKQLEPPTPKRYLTNFEPNWPKSREQSRQFYQREDKQYEKNKYDLKFSKQKSEKSRKSSALDRKIQVEKSCEIDENVQIREDSIKSVKKSRGKLKVSLVRQIKVIELEDSQDENPKTLQKEDLPKENSSKLSPLQRNFKQKSSPYHEPIEPQIQLRPIMTLNQQQQQKIKYYKLLDEQIMEIVLNMKNGKPFNQEQQQDKNCDDENMDTSINRITYYMNKKYNSDSIQTTEQQAIQSKKFTPELILSRVTFIFTAVCEFINLAFLNHLKFTEKNTINSSKKKPIYDIKEILLTRLKENILVLFVKEQETQKIKDKKKQERRKNVINLQENDSPLGEQQSGQTENTEIDEIQIKQAVSKMNQKMKSLLFQQGMKKLVTQELSNFYKKHLLKFTQTTNSKKKFKPQALKYHRVAISSLHKSFLQAYYKFYQQDKQTLEERKKKDLMKEEYLGRIFEQMMPLLMDMVDEVVVGKKDDKKGKYSKEINKKKDMQVQRNQEQYVPYFSGNIENQITTVQKTKKKRGRKPKNKNLKNQDTIEEDLPIVEHKIPIKIFKESALSLIPSIKNQNQSQLKESHFVFEEQQNIIPEYIQEQLINPVEQQIIKMKIQEKLEKKKLRKNHEQNYSDGEKDESVDFSKYMLPIELEQSAVQKNHEIYDEEEDFQFYQTNEVNVNQVQPFIEYHLPEIQQNSPEQYVWSDYEDSPVNALIQLENRGIQSHQIDKKVQSNHKQQSQSPRINRLKSSPNRNEVTEDEQIDLSQYMIPCHQTAVNNLQKNTQIDVKCLTSLEQTKKNHKGNSEKQQSQQEPSIKKTKPIQKAQKPKVKDNSTHPKLKIVKVDPVPVKYKKEKQNIKEKPAKKSQTNKTQKAQIEVSKPAKTKKAIEYIPSSSESQESSAVQNYQQTPPQCQPESPQTNSSSQKPEYKYLDEKLRNIESQKMSKEQEEKMLKWYMQNNRKEVEQMMNLYLEMQKVESASSAENQEYETNHLEQQNDTPSSIRCEELLEDEEKLIYFNNFEQTTESQSPQYQFQAPQDVDEVYQLNSNEQHQICEQLQKIQQVQIKPATTRSKAKVHFQTQKKSKPKSKPKPAKKSVRY